MRQRITENSVQKGQKYVSFERIFVYFLIVHF